MDNTLNKENWFELVTQECKEYSVPPSRNCIDVGANVGGFVEAHKDKIQNFFCVEPGSSNIEEFKTHHSNLLKSGRVKICNRAVHNKSNSSLKLKRYIGEGMFANSGSNSTFSFQYKNGHGWSDDPDEYEEVKTISFEDVMKKALSYFDAVEIDVLKVDCEGAEYEFLIDQDLSKIKLITMEIHNFLDCFPAKDNPRINQRVDLIYHISKTHDLFFSKGYPQLFVDPLTDEISYDRSDIISSEETNPAHGIVSFRRKT